MKIAGRMKVKTLKSQFKSEFGLTLRVYDGRSFAADESTLASIRKGDAKGGEFSPRKNTKVGNFENKIIELFGIKNQIAGSDDSYLCDNNVTLAKALVNDELKSKKKQGKKENKPKEVNVKTEEKKTEYNKNMFLIEISGNGGEYQAVLEKNQENINSINEYLNSSDELEDMWDILDIDYSTLCYQDYDNLYNEFGINVQDEFFIKIYDVSHIKDDDTYDIEGTNAVKVYDTEQDDDLVVMTFTENYPSVEMYKEKLLNNSEHNSDSIILLSRSEEEGVLNRFLLTTDDNNFDFSKLFIGDSNTDELLHDGASIVSHVYYLEDSYIISFLKETYNDDQFKEKIGNDDLERDDLLELLSEALQNDEQKRALFNKNSLRNLGHLETEPGGLYPSARNMDGEWIVGDPSSEDDLGCEFNGDDEDDLESAWVLSDKAKEFITEGNLDAARECIEQGVSIAEDSSDLVTLATVACSSDEDEGLADKDWGRQLFEQAEGKADGFWDIKNIAEEVSQENLLDDKKWATNLFKQLENDAENADQLLDIADSVENSLEDNAWVLSLYRQAEAAEEVTSSDFSRLANYVARLDEKDWAKSLYEKSFDSAEDSSDLISLAEALKDDFDDRKWADNVIEAAIEKSEDVSDLIQCAQILGWQFEDKDKARSIYEQAVEKADDVDEYQEIAESMIDEDYLGDKDWAQRLASEHGFDSD